MQYTIAAIAALAALPTTFAQTFTDCNPLEKTCPNDVGLATATHFSDWTKGLAEGWTLLAGTSLSYTPQGAQFSIAKVGQAPTIESDFHILFGVLEVRMQAAAGQGIVSSIVFESADLDEIDWEFIGNDYEFAQTNYFGKGDTTTYDRVAYLPLSPPPQNAMHTYTVDWSPERMIYSIDGVERRTVRYADANGGKNYPQTPMKIKLGNWAGGAPGSPEGTAKWAGGYTDYSQGPFNMIVESVKITNANPAKEYIWTDRSGSYQSIKVVGPTGGTTNADAGAAVPAAKESSSAASVETKSATSVQKAPGTTTEASTTVTEAPKNTSAIVSTTSAAHNTTLTTSSSATTSSTATRSTTVATVASATAAPSSTGAASSNSAMSGLALLITLGVASWML